MIAAGHTDAESCRFLRRDRPADACGYGEAGYEREG